MDPISAIEFSAGGDRWVVVAKLDKLYLHSLDELDWAQLSTIRGNRDCSYNRIMDKTRIWKISIDEIQIFYINNSNISAQFMIS